jgi:hypothetical protein
LVCQDEAFFHRVHGKGKTIDLVSRGVKFAGSTSLASLFMRLPSLSIHPFTDAGEQNGFQVSVLSLMTSTTLLLVNVMKMFTMVLWIVGWIPTS